MVNKAFGEQMKILAFNRKKKLVAIFPSLSTAGMVVKTAHQAILRCCRGELVTAADLYWRKLPNDVIMDSDDVGRLTLTEYDRQMGITFRKFRTASSKRDFVR